MEQLQPTFRIGWRYDHGFCFGKISCADQLANFRDMSAVDVAHDHISKIKTTIIFKKTGADVAGRLVKRYYSPAWKIPYSRKCAFVQSRTDIDAAIKVFGRPNNCRSFTWFVRPNAQRASLVYRAH